VTDRYTDVAIIGGSAAGIDAGRQLADECVDCLIVEARRRLGGANYLEYRLFFGKQNAAMIPRIGEIPDFFSDRREFDSRDISDGRELWLSGSETAAPAS